MKKGYIINNNELVKEWDYRKNTLDPKSTTCGSTKKAWWICPNKHSYDMRIDHRNNGHGCPYCAGKKILKNINDLATVYPNLAKQWNYKKNYPLTPSDIM